ncbi:MAG: ATP-grasp domain-containing protein [Nocardioidaceae bacterium]|nr:ATP-grasp domain-containing protein [Nocardioidaceae bacterium]
MTSLPARPFGTLLVANRGEIALRVIRACHASAVRSIAVYTAADRAAPHVLAADDAVRVESYLDGEAVVAAAVASGAEAVHPGYGFLSEHAAFARAVADAGLVFVGPPADVIEQMGRKDHARSVAVAAGVPCVPSHELSPSLGAPVRGDDDRPPPVAYPLLVKAAAGGGGKGMRVVRHAADLDEALAAGGREALASFGDDTLLVEQYVEHGRHVEVQVLADAHGSCLHLYERDCSTQRRHQKVLEEAPAPTISADLRTRLCEAAVALARAVGYVNAGTVEFLVAGEDFFFLEMNTRLQVEHPVTEMVCGLDLVGLQLLVAGGAPLPIGQDDVRVDGHAIEARVYAEDAFHGFLPQAGEAILVRWPAQARVDAALSSGQVVGTAYDPMLGKIVVHGRDRETARRALVAALDDTAILGLTTNVGFLRVLAAGAAFRDAAINTSWLDSATIDEPELDAHRVLAAWAVAAVLVMTDGDPHPFAPDGWRLGGPPTPVRVELDRPVLVDRVAGRVDDTPVEELRCAYHVVVLDLGGRLLQGVVNVTAHAVEVVHQGHRHVFVRPDVLADHATATADGDVVAPMPGTVLAVRVRAGETVLAGQPLGALEAMKMELALTAPFDGTVAAVGAAAGDQVPIGHVLFRVAPAPADLSAT